MGRRHACCSGVLDSASFQRGCIRLCPTWLRHWVLSVLFIFAVLENTQQHPTAPVGIFLMTAARVWKRAAAIGGSSQQFVLARMLGFRGSVIYSDELGLAVVNQRWKW